MNHLDEKTLIFRKISLHEVYDEASQENIFFSLNFVRINLAQ